MEAGRFVKRRPNGTEVWAFGTGGHLKAYLAMQSDRNVVIYAVEGVTVLGALWTQCIYTVSPALVTVAFDGTPPGSATVAAQKDCPWTVTAPNRVHFAGPSSGFANPDVDPVHTFTFTVDANQSAAERQVDVTIGGVI
jgi:hypothetical protein